MPESGSLVMSGPHIVEKISTELRHVADIATVKSDDDTYQLSISSKRDGTEMAFVFCSDKSCILTVKGIRIEDADPIWSEDGNRWDREIEEFIEVLRALFDGRAKQKQWADKDGTVRAVGIEISANNRTYVDIEGRPSKRLQMYTSELF